MRLPARPGWPRLSPAAALAGLLCVWVALWAWQRPTHSLDDAYITYRYAHNLAAGQGFVFNPGERVLGTTTPGYTLLLAAGALAGLDLPALSIFYDGLGWAAAVGLLYALGREAGAPGAGLIGAGLLAFDPLVNGLLGMETHVYIAVVVLAFYLQARGRPRLAALAAGAAFLLRWDGILVVAVVMLAELARTRRLPWQAAAIALAVMVPWLVFSQLYFGSIFPNTFFAKAGQALTGLQGGGATPFVAQGRNLLLSRVNGHWAGALYGPLAALGVLALWLRPRLAADSAGGASRPLARLWPLLLYTALYTAGYAALNVIGFGWYFIPIFPAVALAVGLGAEALVLAGLRPWRRAPWRVGVGAALVVALGAVLVWPQARGLPWGRGQVGAGRVHSYQLAADWLRANTPPEATVAMLEIGVVGYASQRPIVDMMGLVTPSMIGHLEAWDQVNYYAVARHWPDYVLTLNSMALNRPTPDDWFARTYALAATLENPNDRDAPLRLYARRADFPPAAYPLRWPQGWVFDGQLALTAIEATTAPLAPAAEWPVRLHWQALADVAADYQFDFELVDLRDGTRWPVGARWRPFYEGGPTTQWRAGQQYAEDRLLTLPAGLPPGDYRLLVRAYHAGTEAVPLVGDTEYSALAGTGRLTTAQAPPPLPPFRPAPVDLDSGLRLLGSQQGGGQLTLFWEAGQPLPRELTTFVHLLDAQGALVAQHDSPPALGQLPATLWEPGLTVVDPHPLDPPAGVATVCFGVYDSLTLARVPVLSAPGYTVRDDTACRPWVP